MLVLDGAALDSSIGSRLPDSTYAECDERRGRVVFLPQVLLLDTVFGALPLDAILFGERVFDRMSNSIGNQLFSPSDLRLFEGSLPSTVAIARPGQLTLLFGAVDAIGA